MKNFLAASFVALLANVSYALPIDFNITGSSLTTSGGGLALSSYSDNALSFQLDDGAYQNVTFGTVKVKGIAAGNLALTIDFATPVNNGVGGTGSYQVLGTFIYNSGKLQWDGPTTVAYNYLGNIGAFEISFDEIDSSSWFTYPEWDLTGRITNLGSQPAAVPEPATLALLGLGLTGLGIARRRMAA